MVVTQGYLCRTERPASSFLKTRRSESGDGLDRWRDLPLAVPCCGMRTARQWGLCGSSSPFGVGGLSIIVDHGFRFVRLAADFASPVATVRDPCRGQKNHALALVARTDRLLRSRGTASLRARLCLRGEQIVRLVEAGRSFACRGWGGGIVLGLVRRLGWGSRGGGRIGD